MISRGKSPLLNMRNVQAGDPFNASQLRYSTELYDARDREKERDRSIDRRLHVSKVHRITTIFLTSDNCACGHRIALTCLSTLPMPLKARVEQLFVGGGGWGCVYTLPVVRLISMARWRWPRTLNWGRETSLLTPTLFGPSFHLYRMSLIVYPTEKIERPPAVGTYLRGSPQTHFSSEGASTYLAPPSNLTSPLSFTFSPFCLFTIFILSFFLSIYLSLSLSQFVLFSVSLWGMPLRRELSRAQIKLTLKEHVGGISGV